MVLLCACSCHFRKNGVNYIRRKCNKKAKISTPVLFYFSWRRDSSNPLFSQHYTRHDAYIPKYKVFIVSLYRCAVCGIFLRKKLSTPFCPPLIPISKFSQLSPYVSNACILKPVVLNMWLSFFTQLYYTAACSKHISPGINLRIFMNCLNCSKLCTIFSSSPNKTNFYT